MIVFCKYNEACSHCRNEPGRLQPAPGDVWRQETRVSAIISEFVWVATTWWLGCRYTAWLETLPAYQLLGFPGRITLHMVGTAPIYTIVHGKSGDRSVSAQTTTSYIWIQPRLDVVRSSIRSAEAYADAWPLHVFSQCFGYFLILTLCQCMYLNMCTRW